MSTNSPVSEAELKPANTNPIPLQHQSPFRKWAGLGVLSLGLAIVIIDTTLLNVSLSYIIRDLHTDIQSLQWVITAYALVLAAFTITGGRLGDLFGRRKMFMLGAIVFAIGSYMASSSHAMFTLLMGESIIEGFGAALMMPATASLVVANYKGRERATAFGVWGAVAGASSAVGPLLGGWLATHYSWRWGFRINVFVAAIVIIGSLLLLQDSRDERKPTLDWIGVLLSALGLLGITYGIIESSTYGWWKAAQLWSLGNYQINFWNLSVTPIAMLVGFILIILFLLWEKRVEARGKSPLVSLSLFKNQQFTSGSITISIMTLGMTGTFFALPIYLQAVKSMDAFHTGLVFLPLSVSLLVMAPLTAKLSHKIAPKYLIQFGLLVATLGSFLIRWGIGADGGTGHLIPGLIVFGVGMGFVFAPISGLTLSSVPVEMAGEASGVNNTMRQVGTSLGAAIIGAAVITLISTSLTKGIQNSPVIPQNAKPAIIQQFSSANSNVEFGGAGNPPPGTPKQVTDEIQNLAKLATTKAAQDGYIYAAMFTLLGFAASLFLPKTDVHDEEQHLNVASLEDDPHRRRKFAGAGALAVIAIGGGILLLHNSSAKIISTGSAESMDDIQNTFKPVPPTSTPTTTVTPTSTPATKSKPPKKVPPKQKPQVAGAATPTVQTYKNPAMGFEVQLSSTWQVQEQNGHVVFVSQSGQQTSVQMYQYSSDLNAIQTQLQGSPSVNSVSQSTFLGEPALHFTTTSGQQGLAVIHQGKLYYIMGQLTSGPLASFKFL